MSQRGPHDLLLCSMRPFSARLSMLACCWRCMHVPLVFCLQLVISKSSTMALPDTPFGLKTSPCYALKTHPRCRDRPYDGYEGMLTHALDLLKVRLAGKAGGQAGRSGECARNWVRKVVCVYFSVLTRNEHRLSMAWRRWD